MVWLLTFLMAIRITCVRRTPGQPVVLRCKSMRLIQMSDFFNHPEPRWVIARFLNSILAFFYRTFQLRSIMCFLALSMHGDRGKPSVARYPAFQPLESNFLLGDNEFFHGSHRVEDFPGNCLIRMAGQFHKAFWNDLPR